ncbi:uncharacterized protein LOC121051657 [Rosa chinensis]|uniref:uncharacterized protein LOC121051657 n=1 Tax=Rosa chinensis TaxID=74649 RepID=UPI001AD8BF62|nr:uncharacterized protein LOC121051657 [Rosa chinensis]
MVLIIEQFDELKVVKIEDGAMPQLKRLTMCKCQNLKSLPEGVAGLNAFEEIRWNEMPDEFTTMVQERCFSIFESSILRDLPKSEYFSLQKHKANCSARGAAV